MNNPIIIIKKEKESHRETLVEPQSERKKRTEVKGYISCQGPILPNDVPACKVFAPKSKANQSEKKNYQETKPNLPPTINESFELKMRLSRLEEVPTFTAALQNLVRWQPAVMGILLKIFLLQNRCPGPGIVSIFNQLITNQNCL